MRPDSLGDRMKAYENVNRNYLPENLPVLIRHDMCAGHTFTRGFERPFDKVFISAMQNTTLYLAKKISGCKLAYTQSDEISLLLTNNDSRDTQPWFDNNINKLVSVSASMATMAFNYFYQQKVNKLAKESLIQQKVSKLAKESLIQKTPISENSFADSFQKNFSCYFQKNNELKQAIFDSRTWVLPNEEVVNYFLWRQNDCTRNSILSVAQSMFSQNEMQGLKCDQLQDKMFKEKNVNWNNYPTYQKRGTCVIKRDMPVICAKPGERSICAVRPTWVFDLEIPIFSQDRDYINNTFNFKKGV